MKQAFLQMMKVVMKHHAAIVDNVTNLERQFAFDDQEFCKEWRRYIGKAWQPCNLVCCSCFALCISRLDVIASKLL